MKTYEELKEEQEMQDEKIVACPKCGKEEKWGFLREWGDCSRCVAKEMQKHEPHRPLPEDIFGKEKISF